MVLYGFLNESFFVGLHMFNPKALFASLEGEGRGAEGFGGTEIKRKLEKSFTFFEKVFFIENDK
jgi:hypothetical protein